MNTFNRLSTFLRRTCGVRRPLEGTRRMQSQRSATLGRGHVELLEERVFLSGTQYSDWPEAAEQETVFNISSTDNAFSAEIVDGRTTYRQLNVPSNASSPEASARAFLASFSGTQNLKVGPNDLRLIEVKYGLASMHTRFQQLIDGLPVYGAYVSVHQGPDGAVQTVHSRAYDKLSLPPNKSVGLSLGQAELSARAAARVVTPYLPTRGELIWYPLENETAVKAWQVTVSSIEPVGEFLTLVDAQTGEVLSQTNLISFDTGIGDIFLPNPYQTQGSGTGLSDNNDANSPPLEAQLITVQLDGLNPGTGLLVGEFVDLATLDSPTLPDVDANELTRVYQYTRDDPRFEQVVIYDTIDSIQRYIQSLGFVGATGIRDFPTVANAHWDTDDNSFFNPTNDTLHFGDGGVDDGEDGDIIAHEYGHAIQSDQNFAFDLGSGEMEAMGEGFGDYLAASFFADEGDPTYQSSDAACVGEWDATEYIFTTPPCVRRVDGNKTYPDDLVGQEHDDGEIWSAALWDLRGILGGPTVDQLVLEHHFALPFGATMPDAAEAILLADQNINGGVNESVIRQVFVDRGILDPPDDHGNDAGSATPVGTNSSNAGVIEVPDDVDWFSFSAQSGFDYTFETVLGTLSDSVLRLISTDGTMQLDIDDDGGPGLASLINWPAPSSGTYYLEVSSFGSNTGSYDLDITETAPDDHGNDPGSATPVGTNSSNAGVIEVPDDVDWFSFSAQSGFDYTFETVLGTLSDSVLRLISTDGTMQLDIDDDGGPGLASLINWPAPSSGTYYLEVSSFGSNTGSYDLDITETPPVGDMNGDGFVNTGDVPLFIQALVDRAAYVAQFPGLDPDILGDVDGSGTFDLGDINAFSDLFGGSTSASGSASASVTPNASMAVVAQGMAIGNEVLYSDPSRFKSATDQRIELRTIDASFAKLEEDRLLLTRSSEMRLNAEVTELASRTLVNRQSSDMVELNWDIALLDMMEEVLI